MIRAGLFCYDHLGGRRTLEGSCRVRFAGHAAGRPLKSEFSRGFVYSDAVVQDARLVVLNCMDAAGRGATIVPRTRCQAARRQADNWLVNLRTADGGTREVRGRGLVNATGPWAARFPEQIAGLEHCRDLRLIKGSHIVVPKLYDHGYAYMFQQSDGRIVFAIPYERDFTLIGTTDVDYEGMPGRVAIDGDEIGYLCAAINGYFDKGIEPADVIWSYSGIRPLLDDRDDNASDVTRDYRIQVDTQAAPLLNVFGGKLTLFRRLAEEAVDRIAPELGNDARPWTGTGYPLPGGEEPRPERLLESLDKSHPFMPSALARRLVFSYGTRSRRIVGDAGCLDDLGPCFGSDLYQAEVDYLVGNEWARTAADILWRRSKLGLRFADTEVRALAAYLGDRMNGAGAGFG